MRQVAHSGGICKQPCDLTDTRNSCKPSVVIPPSRPLFVAFLSPDRESNTVCSRTNKKKQHLQARECQRGRVAGRRLRPGCHIYCHARSSPRLRRLHKGLAAATLTAETLLPRTTHPTKSTSTCLPSIFYSAASRLFMLRLLVLPSGTQHAALGSVTGVSAHHRRRPPPPRGQPCHVPSHIQERRRRRLHGGGLGRQAVFHFYYY